MHGGFSSTEGGTLMEFHTSSLSRSWQSPPLISSAVDSKVSFPNASRPGMSSPLTSGDDGLTLEDLGKELPQGLGAG
jgi:hypothetical protein